jgi:prolycopene isomerase
MISRRDFLRLSAFAAAGALINWECPVYAKGGNAHKNGYDVIIIGAGLGGLSCAAFLAGNGFKPLVIEAHDKPGGYATSFKRGRFKCEVSLHATTPEDPVMKAMLEQLNVRDKITFVPHEHAWSSVFPDFSLDLPVGDFDTIKNTLIAEFGSEPGLPAYMETWQNLFNDMEKFISIGMPEDPNQLPYLYPTLAFMVMNNMTLADVQNFYQIGDPALKAILGQSWTYYGLPPSQIPAFYYLYATGIYHTYGGYYLEGTSQSLSNALSEVIIDAGGEVILKTEVTEIIVENNRAVGVKARGKEYYGNAVVSNASIPQTLDELLPPSVELPQDYLDKISSAHTSLSSFNVWLGLNRDITSEIAQSTVSFYPGYDFDDAYDGALLCDMERSGVAMVFPDNLIDGFSPRGHSLIVLTAISGYEPWAQFEQDYFAGKKKRYYEKKDRITEIIIGLAEEHLVPGLSDMIVMQEASTPLTNIRYTSNTFGAMYGYSQTLDNSGLFRLTNKTPVEGLYLSSAWAYPGAGYSSVLLAGKEAVRYMCEDGVLAC